VSGRITASDYVDILGSQVHLVVQVLFPNSDAVYQDNSPYTQPEVFSLGLRNMKMLFNIISG
jgi:glucose/arabinose dehydrogenase